MKKSSAVELYESGQKPIDIARNLGVTRGAVSQWLKKYREKGIEAMYYRHISRKPCRLSPEQEEQIQAMLLQGAAKYGYADNLWTASRVRDLIEMNFAIKYCIRQVSRLLKKWNWSPQKPAMRAGQVDEESASQ